MSWLANRKIQHLYRNLRGHEIVVEYSSKEEPPEYLTGPTDDPYKRICMLPYKVNLTFRIQFERNGLVAYKYDQGDGKPRVVSATRENYEHNIGNTSGAKLRELKEKGQMSRAAPSITTKGYKDTYKKVQAKKGAR